MRARQFCCLWSWRASSGLRQWQHNLACETILLPLVLVSFIGSSAVAAKSCLRDKFAAFGLGVLLRVFGSGSKILLARQFCCLWARRASSGLRQWQQNPACETILLPLGLASFFGSSAVAAKSCLRDNSAAFGPGEFHQIFGSGSKILLARQFCCLWS